MSIIQSSLSTYFTDYISLSIYISLSLPLTNGSFNSPASVQTKAHTDLERLSSVESQTRLVAISSRRHEMCEGEKECEREKERDRKRERERVRV